MHCFIFEKKAGGATLATEQLLAELRLLMPITTLSLAYPGEMDNPERQFRLVRKDFYLARKVVLFLLSLRGKITTVYSTSSLALFFSMFLLPRHVPRIYHFHGDSYRLINPRKWHVSAIKKYLYILPYYSLLQAIETFTCNRAAAIIVPSTYSRNAFKRLHPEVSHARIHILPNGVSASLFYAGTYPRIPPLRTLFIGRADPRKGLLQLLEAVRLLPRNSGIRLTLALLHNNQPEFEASLEQHRQPDTTIVWDTPYSQMGRLYRSHNLLILPSEDEQLPLAYLEALACGVPVICTGVGEMQKLQRKISRSLLLPSATPTHIRTAWLRFRRSSMTDIRSMRKRGLILATDFSWRNSALGLRELLSGLERRERKLWDNRSGRDNMKHT